jgi:hypothetical protein
MKIDDFFIILQIAHLVPLAIAGIRYSRIDPSYRPFILLLLLGFLNETANYISIKTIGANSVSFNVFQIIDCCILLYQFKAWGFFKNKNVFLTLIIVALSVWVTENFIYSSILTFNPYFRVSYAFLIELIIANRIIYVVTENTSIIKNAKFLICIGLVIMFMYQIVFEGVLISDPSMGTDASKLIIKSFGFMNVFVQLLYAWAFAVAPAKLELLWTKKTI